MRASTFVALVVLALGAGATYGAHELLKRNLPAGVEGWIIVSPMALLVLMVAAGIAWHGRRVTKQHERERAEWLARALPEAAQRRGGKLTIRIAAQELGLTPEGAAEALEESLRWPDQSVAVDFDEQGDPVYEFGTKR